MNTETLELEPIERTAQRTAPSPASPLTPVAAAARAIVTVREAALARFTPTETHLLDMAARFKDVAWDTSTPKALADTKAARLEMRQEGRFIIQRLVDSTKTELNDLKKVVEAEGERLIAIIKPAEDGADKAIKDQETKDEEVKEKKRKADADAANRKAGFEAKLDTIKGYPEKATGKDSTTIANGIKYVQGLDVSVETWAEFAPRAIEAKAEALKALDALHVKAVAAELAEQERSERLAAAEKQQALVDELGKLASLPATAKAANTLQALTDAVDTAKAWDMDPTRWGVMHMAAQSTRTSVLTELAGILGVYSAAVQAAAPAPAPAPETTAAARAAFSEPEDEVPAPTPAPVAAPAIDPARATAAEPIASVGRLYRSSGFRAAPVAPLVAAPETAAVVEALAHKAETQSELVEIAFTARDADDPARNAVLAPPAPQVATLSVTAINARFGEGLSMTRAYIETVLGVAPDEISPRKLPLWTERSFIAIASRLSQRAQEIALC